MENQHPEYYQLFIGGKFVEAASGKRFPSLNPANGETVAEAAEGDREDIDRAVKAARRAFGSWRKMPGKERGRILRNAAERILERAEELARLESLDSGKPIRETREGDIPASAATFEFWASLADKIGGRVIPVEGEFLNYTLREPMGVVGLIIPWNYPLLMAAWKIAPALACGNTAVLKPAEQTPVTAMILASILAESGVPEGVVNVVNGFGPTAGGALATHPDVDKIAFTGEWKTAQEITRASAVNLKRLSFELGGKSPMIVFPDCDLEQAVKSGLFGIYFCQGENCDAMSRMFLHEDIYQDYRDLFVERSRRIRVGDPLEEATEMGAIISRKQLERIRNYVEIGIGEGAEVCCGGDSPRMDGLGKGHFFNPTVLGGVDNRMRVAQEEIFGPVASLIPFKEEEEASRMANQTMYGLTASIWTSDVRRAHRVAAELRAGTVQVNTSMQVSPASPFGGYKMSGYGREGGSEAIDLYTEVKSVWIDLGGESFDWYRG